jgi:predicted nucleic acid-binding protein
MNVLLDTNIPGRMAEAGHPKHQIAVDSVAALISRGDSPCLVPHVLYEFWVVATRPLAANGLGLSAAEANAEISRLETLYPILQDSSAIYPEWKRIVAAYQVLGKNAHDARLVAAMAMHRITHILMFNPGHFGRFPGIVALDPGSLVAPLPP